MSICTRVGSYLYNKAEAAVRNAPEAFRRTRHVLEVHVVHPWPNSDLRKYLVRFLAIHQLIRLPNYILSNSKGTILFDRCQKDVKSSATNCKPGFIPININDYNQLVTDVQLVTAVLSLANATFTIGCLANSYAIPFCKQAVKSSIDAAARGCDFTKRKVMPLCKQAAKSSIDAAARGCDFTKRKVIPLCKQAAKSSIKAAVWGIEQIKEIGQSRGQRARSANATAVVRAVNRIKIASKN